MAEPLTDEEFDLIKDADFCDVREPGWKRVIATVEKEKEENARLKVIISASDVLVAGLTKDRDKLFEDQTGMSMKVDKFREENAQLKEDYYVPSVTIKELREENAKLKELSKKFEEATKDALEDLEAELKIARESI